MFNIIISINLIFLIISSIDATCDSSRICKNINDCKYYSDLFEKYSRPLPLPLGLELKKNLCGFIDKNTPQICCPILPDSTKRNIEISSLNHKNLYLLPKTERCGSIQMNSRITYGDKTTLSEFPWMALLAYMRQDDRIEFKCAGTLINRKFILTAAHCINDRLLGVRLGEYDVNSDIDCSSKNKKCRPPVQNYPISKVITHPDYNTLTHINDIALIKLAIPVRFISGHIEPICLPITQNSLLNGKQGIIVGWGRTEDALYSPILKKAAIQIMPLDVCKEMYLNRITPNHICAGGPHGKDSCEGDSGGPLHLIEEINGYFRFVQYGIVSHGPISCGLDDKPAVYTNVKKYLFWILNNLTQ